jgi:hypothetical protein
VRILGGSESLCHGDGRARSQRHGCQESARALRGDDVINASSLEAGGIQLTMNGGLGEDILIGSEGGAFVQGGRLALGGPLPTNTDGGGLSSNHPGMRGIFLVIEAAKQLRGECGPRQVAECEVALCHGTGGMLGLLHSVVTMVLAK